MALESVSASTRQFSLPSARSSMPRSRTCRLISIYGPEATMKKGRIKDAGASARPRCKPSLTPSPLRGSNRDYRMSTYDRAVRGPRACSRLRRSRRSIREGSRGLGWRDLAEGRLRLDHLPAARRNHTNPSPQNASVTRKPTPLPGKRQTFAARLRPIARPASARALLSP